MNSQQLSTTLFSPSARHNLWRSSLVLMSLCLILMLGGCASKIKTLPTLSQTNQPQAKQGVVVARVINASAFALPFNTLTITPKDFAASEKGQLSQLNSLSTSMSNSGIFAAPVAAGSYSLWSTTAWYSRGQFWISRGAGADVKFGTFEVKPGQTTDLGTLIYYPKPQQDKYTNLLLRLPESQPGEVLETYFPFYQYDKTQVLGWNPDDNEEDRESMYISVAQNPVTYTDKYLAPDNSLYFLSKLGVILKRDVDGQWSIDAVDTNLKLNSIEQNTAGDLIVGGGEGRIFLKRQAGDWQNISMTSDKDIVRVSFRDDGEIEVITRQPQQVTVYSAPIDSSDSALSADIPWQQLAHFTPTKGWKSKAMATDSPVVKNKAQKAKVDSWKARQKAKLKNGGPNKVISQVQFNDDPQQPMILIGTLGTSFNPFLGQAKINHYRYDPLTWRVESGTEDTAVSRRFSAGAVTMGVKFAGFWSWDGQPDYMILDENQQQWVEISSKALNCDLTDGGECKAGALGSKKEGFSFASIPWFKTRQEGVALVVFSDFNFWTGSRTNKTKVVHTLDGGLSWKTIGSKLPNDYCRHFVPEVTDRLMLSCNGASGDFYESTDLGVTWQQVREHENF